MWQKTVKTVLGMGILTQTLLAAEPVDALSLMAWNPVNGSGFPKLEYASLFAGMTECGLDIAGFVRPEGLEALAEAGLSAFVYDERAFHYDWRNFDVATARRNFAALAAEVGDHPAAIGYYLKDEPSGDELEGLAAMVEIIRELAPGKLSYINLLPNYADAATQLQTESYEQYLEKYLTLCRPQYVSYDFYSLLEPGITGGVPSFIRPGFWHNLRQVRAAAQAHHLPFWVIGSSAGLIRYRVPDGADIGFQAYCALAHGARGIGFFTYIAPCIGNFRGAPVDQFGQKTGTWHALARVNRIINNWKPILNQLQSTRVYHIPADFAEAQSPDSGSLVAGLEGGKFLVGEFLQESTGINFLMVVNCDLENSAPVEIAFRRPPTQVMAISPWEKGVEISYEGEQKWLEPGGAVLLKIIF